MTYYKELNKLFSSVKIEDNGHHARLTLFMGGANCGTLILVALDLRNFLPLLFTGSEVCRGSQYFEVEPERQYLSELGEIKLGKEIFSA